VGVGCEALGHLDRVRASVLVARLLGQAEFALGSTMVFRARPCAGMGGFETIAHYLRRLPDRRHIKELGYRIEFASVVVETDLGGESCVADLAAPVAVGLAPLRVSRPAGYFGYVVDARHVVGPWWPWPPDSGACGGGAGAAHGGRVVVGAAFSTILTCYGILAHPATRPVRVAVWLEDFPPYRVLGGTGSCGCTMTAESTPKSTSRKPLYHH